MFEDNVCRFVPQRKDPETIHTLNFVYEKNCPYSDSFRFLPSYRLHLVTRGAGALHTPGRSVSLAAGDLFIIFPSAPHRIESTGDLEYMYISFIGTRTNHILDTLRIGGTNILFHDFGHLQPFWTEAILSGSSMFNLASESVLLYTLSILANRLTKETPSPRTATVTVSRIKKFIDDHFGDTDLSLERISEALSYNPKYISRTFKKEMRVSITDYINTIRIHQACILMDQGFTSIRDISLLCGFKDSLYFSRVFKREIGLSPREYVAKEQEKKSAK